MDKISFFTAVSFQNSSKSLGQSLIERVDDYFYLGDKKAHVMSDDWIKGNSARTLLVDEQSSFIVTALKVISYFTVIIPLIMLVAKAIIRSRYEFYLLNDSSNLLEPNNVSTTKLKRESEQVIIEPPLIPFDKPVSLSSKQILAFKINTQTHCSELSCFQDSYFECNFIDLEKTQVIRKRLVCFKNKSFDVSLVDNSSLECKFRINDITLIGKKYLGLRHVSSFEQAQFEVTHGMSNGCSLNISFNKAEGNGKNRFEGLHTKSNHIIEEQLIEYEKGITDFIISSMVMDMGIRIERFDYPSKKRLNKIVNIVENVVKKTHFLLLNYRNGWVVSDPNSWGNGLGRFPKCFLEGKNIVILKSPEKDDIIKKISHEMLCDAENLFNFLAACYMKSLLKTLRSTFVV